MGLASSTHPTFISTLVLALLGAMAGQGAEPAKPLWLSSAGSQPPRLYLFWQTGWFPKRDPRHIELVHRNPPDLIQYPGASGVPTGIPNDSMCPAPGEQSTRWWYQEKSLVAGKADQVKPQWWTPEEYAARIAEGAEGVDWVTRQTGVHGVAPYICAVKIQGDHEKRLRFWSFYDHWDLYGRWYGARPDTDPWEWIQIRADYRTRHLWGFYQPTGDGSNIYSACPNSPFSDYLARLVGIAAKSGVRGVFVDNPLCHCICPFCQRQWQAYLAGRFTREQLKRYFSLDDYAQAKLGDKALEVESKRFWARSTAKHLGRMRQAGEAVWGKGNFWMCPNGSPIEFVPNSNGFDAVEWAAEDAFQVGCRENCRSSEGFERTRLGQDLYLNTPDDLILGHKMARALVGSPAWAAPLRSHEFLGKDPNLYNLAAAETLAFDGVLCDTASPYLPAVARQPFYKFYRRHESVLRSGRSVAEAAVLCFGNELFRDPADSVRECRLVTDWLSEARVLWDALMDDGLSPSRLARYRAVFVPNVRMLDDGEVEMLLTYARGGGRLILSGEVGTSYRCGVRRDVPAFADICPKLTTARPYAVATLGKGKIAWCPRGFADADLPANYTGSDVRCEQPARSLICQTNRATFLSCIDECLGCSLSSIAPPGHRAVRIAARWFEEGDEATMTVHLANYDLETHTAARSYYRVLCGPSQLRPAEAVSVAVPLPAGYVVRAARLASLPGKEAQNLEFRLLADGVQFMVPRIDSYSFVQLDLARGSAASDLTLAKVRGPRTSAAGSLPILEGGAGAAKPLAYAAEPGSQSLDSSLSVAPGTPVIVEGHRGEKLEIRLSRPGQKSAETAIWSPLQAADVHAEAERGEVRWLRFWVVSPTGAIAASGAVPANRATMIALPVTETGLYALITEAGPGSLALTTNSRTLMAAGTPLRFEDPPPRLFFSVPGGTREFEITTGGLDEKVELKVVDASGVVRLARRDFNPHFRADKIAVPAGQDGKIWRLETTTGTPEGRRAGRRTQIELSATLPGFFAPAPWRLAVLD